MRNSHKFFNSPNLSIFFNHLVSYLKYFCKNVYVLDICVDPNAVHNKWSVNDIALYAKQPIFGSTKVPEV